jgi:hypothetical protein
MKFANWLDTFLKEKGVDLEQSFTVEGKSGPNYMAVANVVDAMKFAPAHEQEKIKTTFVKIDFANGDVMHFIKHLAQAIAV